MELNCKHNSKPCITKLIDHAQLQLQIVEHYTYLNLYKSRASWKYSNLSAEFEDLMGKYSNLVSF